MAAVPQIEPVVGVLANTVVSTAWAPPAVDSTAGSCPFTPAGCGSPHRPHPLADSLATLRVMDEIRCQIGQVFDEER